jgi:hypothetical protein
MTLSKDRHFALFHCFPRFSSEAPAAEVEAGIKVIKSAISIGLLLTPEWLYFPISELDALEEQSGSDAFQKRLCFTFIREEELVNHSAMFGSFAFEFEMATLRQLGAMPVMYLPQPVRRSDGTSFDHLANNIVHQIRDVATLLEEICDVEKVVSEAVRAGKKKLTLDRDTNLDVASLRFLIDFLRGNKGSFDDLLAYINILASLMYHVDSARISTYFRGIDLEYYRQMEWRIVSGLYTESIEIDRPLGAREKMNLTRIAPLFGKEMTTRDGKLLKIVDLTRAISRVNGKHILEYATRLWVPDIVEREVKALIRKAGLDLSVAPMPYATILELRSMRRSTSDSLRR